MSCGVFMLPSKDLVIEALPEQVTTDTSCQSNGLCSG
jgi:hypothetical protein